MLRRTEMIQYHTRDYPHIAVAGGITTVLILCMVQWTYRLFEFEVEP